MPIARERVVPPVKKAAWARYGYLGFSLGILLGIFAPFFYDSVMALVANQFARSIAAREFVDAFVSSLVLLPQILLLRVTQRWGPLLAFSASIAAAFALVTVLRAILASPDGGADTSNWLVTPFFTRILIIMAVAIVAVILLRVFCRLLVVLLIERGPDDCAWCGYTRGSIAITCCPECGRDSAACRYRMHSYVMSVTYFVRRSTLFLLAACILLLAISTGPILTRTVPAIQFYSRFPEAVRAESVGNELAVWVPQFRSSGKGLAARDRIPTDSKQRTMSIEVAACNERILTTGSRLVIARLNSAQRDFVLNHSVPDALVRRLYARADEINWTMQSTTLGEEAIDATPYFPNEVATPP